MLCVVVFAYRPFGFAFSFLHLFRNSTYHACVRFYGFLSYSVDYYSYCYYSHTFSKFAYRWSLAAGNHVAHDARR